MIVREADDGTLLLMRQVDHAALAGEMAAQLADPRAPASALVAAARAHDNGWREADEAPLVDRETGRPHGYRGYPDAPYRDVWARGIDRAMALDPYVGVLVALHGAQFLARGSDADRAFVRRVRARVDDALADLGLGGSSEDLPEPVRAHFERVRFLDGLSLFACEAWSSPWETRLDGAPLVVARREDSALTTRPWVFRAPFEASVPARPIPRRRYEDTADVLRALADAEPRTLGFRFAPG